MPHFVGYKPEYQADTSFQRGCLEKTENLEKQFKVRNSSFE
jgi:hypothetical protein